MSNPDGYVAKTDGNLVEIVFVSTVVRPTHLRYKPQASRLCRKNELRTGNFSSSMFIIGQLRKFETRILSGNRTLPLLTTATCPLRSISMCIASIPRNVRRALLKEPNPNPGLLKSLEWLHNQFLCEEFPVLSNFLQHNRFHWLI